MYLAFALLLSFPLTHAYPRPTDNCKYTTFVNCNITNCQDGFVECAATDTNRDHCVCSRARLHLVNETNACVYKQHFLSDVTYLQIYLGEFGAAELDIGNKARGGGQLALTLFPFFACIVIAVISCVRNSNPESYKPIATCCSAFVLIGVFIWWIWTQISLNRGIIVDSHGCPLYGQ